MSTLIFFPDDYHFLNKNTKIQTWVHLSFKKSIDIHLFFKEYQIFRGFVIIKDFTAHLAIKNSKLQPYHIHFEENPEKKEK